MRDVVYFPDAATETPLLVLTLWAICGVLVVLALGRTGRSGEPEHLPGLFPLPWTGRGDPATGSAPPYT
ncbi:hypothetical protein [Streptomyces sp. NPDC047061]|uniref:hypothetical protein n=1 Tax=Streptomyces sp. NPDC047061 TaxID=3154605 RepID=UPI0033EEF33A